MDDKNSEWPVIAKQGIVSLVKALFVLALVSVIVFDNVFAIFKACRNLEWRSWLLFVVVFLGMWSFERAIQEEIDRR